MNSFGHNFRLTTFGESHGPAMGGVIDGCPSGVIINEELVVQDLTRRRVGDPCYAADGSVVAPQGHTTPRREADQVEWLSGIYQGRTLGTPIAFMVRNQDARPSDYESLSHCFRPGHADYTYQQKYGIRDPRGGGRASGRETLSRVVGGAVAKQVLLQRGVSVEARIIDRRVVCTASHLPAGVGEPIFDKLNARLAYACMSIPSATAFEMGVGTAAIAYAADQYADAWGGSPEGDLTLTNHCGGVQGGISNGMPVKFSVTFHPPVTQPDGMTCLTEEGSLVDVAPGGRHDSDHLPRCAVVVEAMAAITLLDLLLSK